MKRIAQFLARYFFGAASCLYLFTLGLRSAKNRIFIANICSYFGYSQKVKPIIPGIELSELVPDDTPIEVREPLRNVGNVTVLEVVVIDKLVKRFRPLKVFEIGTFDGRTTLNMAANCPKESVVYTLDLPKEQIDSAKLHLEPIEKIYIEKDISGARYRGTEEETRIIQLYGDSATFDFLPYLGSMDFVFVDGSHSYEYAVSDSRNALRLLKSNGGVIIWHDYGHWDGVTQALNEMYESVAEFRALKHIAGTSLVCLIRQEQK